ncbi:helix-turn-helix domain-containing protein, partial [Streptococcus suis]
EELSHRISKKSSFYLDVYSSLANFYALTSRDEDLESLYEEISEKLSHLDITDTDRFHKYIKIRYNHAHYLFKRKRQPQAIDELTDLIEILRDKKSC